MNLYTEKKVGYFSNARTDIEPLLPAKSGAALRALEIGCSGGHTLAWLKKAGYCSWVAGVEPYAELAISGGVIDQFFKLDIEKEMPAIAEGSIDLLLCLDVLEHLVNPWEAIRKLDRLRFPAVG